MPMPKAIVAQITRTSSRRKSSWCCVRSVGVSPAWYGLAFTPSSFSRSATLSVLLRDWQ